MIDHEAEIFDTIATALRYEFVDIYVAGEHVPQPPQFPAVIIVEMDNSVYQRGIDSGRIENFADVMYQVDVFSNRNRGKKAECREIMGAIDEQFAKLGFVRTFFNPVQNMSDPTIYRMTGRYRAVIGRDNVIYSGR